jgi:SsrA-binding protein
VTQKPAPEINVVAVNRRARADYTILETFEAGIVLTGSEIKSVRARNLSLAEAYAQVRDGELWLVNCYIAPYRSAGHYGSQQDPRRDRKLLLHRTQTARLGLEAARQRLTVVPLRLYIKGHNAKVEVGLARGRRKYEKRDVIEKREAEREIGRAMKTGR